MVCRPRPGASSALPLPLPPDRTVPLTRLEPNHARPDITGTPRQPVGTAPRRVACPPNRRPTFPPPPPPPDPPPSPWEPPPGGLPAPQIAERLPLSARTVRPLLARFQQAPGGPDLSPLPDAGGRPLGAAREALREACLGLRRRHPH